MPHCSPSCRTWTYVSSRRAVKCSLSLWWKRVPGGYLTAVRCVVVWCLRKSVHPTSMAPHCCVGTKRPCRANSGLLLRTAETLNSEAAVAIEGAAETENQFLNVLVNVVRRQLKGGYWDCRGNHFMFCWRPFSSLLARPQDRTKASVVPNPIVVEPGPADMLNAL